MPSPPNSVGQQNNRHHTIRITYLVHLKGTGYNILYNRKGTTGQQPLKTESTYGHLHPASSFINTNLAEFSTRAALRRVHTPFSSVNYYNLQWPGTPLPRTLEATKAYMVLVGASYSEEKAEVGRQVMRAFCYNYCRVIVSAFRSFRWVRKSKLQSSVTCAILHL